MKLFFLLLIAIAISGCVGQTAEISAGIEESEEVEQPKGELEATVEPEIKETAETEIESKEPSIPTPKLTIVSPKADSIWNSEYRYVVIWEAENLENFRVWYTNDSSLPCSGNQWEIIQNKTYTKSRLFWETPDTISLKARLRVEGFVNDNPVINVCSDTFVIRPAPTSGGGGSSGGGGGSGGY